MPTAAEYREQLKQLLPPGQAFPRDPGTTLHDLLDGMSKELARVDERGFAMPLEANPSTTNELLSDWERVAGLPDRCSGVLEETIQGRRNALLAKLASTGGQSAEYFISIAAALGYQVTITEFRPFRVGVSKVGEALTNGDWQFAWQVNAPEKTLVTFRVGLSAVGEALRTWGTGSLECKMRQLAPAHTIPIFTYANSSLDLLFDNDTYLVKQQNSSFGSLITFVRGTLGSRFNSSGVLEMIPVNQPRFDYDPLTSQALGLLIEEARTNLGVQSNSSSTLTPTRATYVDTGQLFIDGVSAFRLLREDSTSANSHFGTPAASTLAANTTYTASYYVKASGRTKFKLQPVNASGWASASEVTYDLLAETAVAGAGVSGTIKKTHGSGIYRVTYTNTVGAAAISASVYPMLLDSAGNASYSGDGASGIHIGGYQIEAGAFETSHIPTTTTAVARAADVASVNTMSPWYNSAEGTLFLWATERRATTNGSFTLSLGSDGTNYFGLGYTVPAGPQGTSYLRKAGAGAAISDPPSGRQKIGLAWSGTSCSLATDGAMRGNATHAGIPDVTGLYIGRGHFGLATTTCYIRKVRYYPRRLSDADLLNLTAS